jgi:predicted dienelactone hydrolase
VRHLLLVCCLIFGSFGPALASVGFQVVHIPDPEGGTIEAGIWYPANAAPRTVQLGLRAQTVAAGAPLVGTHLPLIVISHGNGGFFGGHSDTAEALAQAGFVAAALTHTGDTYPDQSRATDMPNRPRQLSLLISYMLQSWPDHDRLDAARVGAFGFSSGGFTVLAAVGARTDPAAIARHCRILPELYDCHLVAAHKQDAAAWAWNADPRIKAVVAAAPAIGFAFTPQSLAAIRIPVQLWQAQYDHILPAPYYVEPVRRQLRSVEFHYVAGADHFDFMPPCDNPEQIPNICSSPPGFDRAGFHRLLNREIVRFFRRVLR